MSDVVTSKKRLILNLFEMNCVNHPRSVAPPGNNRERFNDIECWGGADD
jgi:hypothetical protein